MNSPLEALAFNPVILGPLFNNLWAWVAMITAATLSFWSLRPSAAVKPHPPPPQPHTTPSPSPETASFEGEKKKEDEEEGVLTRGESFKKRFTVYYEEERENEEDDEVDGGDEIAVVKKWGLTVVIARRGLDMGSGSGSGLGWYGYQDRRVIDGSVVRLWGEERENGRSRRTSVGGVSHSPLRSLRETILISEGVI